MVCLVSRKLVLIWEERNGLIFDFRVLIDII